MTAAQVRAHVAGYRTRGLLSQLLCQVDLEAPVRGPSYRVRVTLVAPDVDHHRPVRVSRTYVVRPQTTDDIDRAVWAALTEALQHEAGEALMHGDRVVFDPHQLPRTWPWGVA